MLEFKDLLKSTQKITSWQDLEPYYTALIERPLTSVDALKNLIDDYSTTFTFFSEQYAWAFIHMTCDTTDAGKAKLYEDLAGLVFPQVKKAHETLHQKILKCEFADHLEPARYSLLLKKFRNASQLFSEKNIPLESELAPLEARYRQITGALTARIGSENLPLPKAQALLKNENRKIREEAWRAIQKARFQAKPELDTLFDRMVKLRHQIAVNAGFKNYRDFKHQEKERFDYTPEDCFAFHESVKNFVLPILNRITNEHRQKLKLGVEDYRPWDPDADLPGQTPLQPASSGQSLLEKGLQVFENLDADLANNIKKMRDHNLFDLEARTGKAPGGYNCYLEITGMPFIFMNAANDHSDVVTLMHECGHASHNFLSNHDPLIFYRDFPIEIAETASMSMELMTSVYWKAYYPSNTDIKRAKIEHWESILSRLPWIALVDKFQHWIYLNPEKTPAERDAQFAALMSEFSPPQIRWQGFERELSNLWQKQLHIFEIPFYYIEYGIAQIGALQVYRNFKKDQNAALASYKKGLSLGGTKPLPQLWENLNIQFDFSEKTIRELMRFVEQELMELYEN